MKRLATGGALAVLIVGLAGGLAVVGLLMATAWGGSARANPGLAVAIDGNPLATPANTATSLGTREACISKPAVAAESAGAQCVDPESGANCSSNVDNDGDTKVNDGCPAVGVKVESGTQCDNATDDDKDYVNDGCPALGAAESGVQCDNNTNDDTNTEINDGCPQSGVTLESGTQCANATDDDTGVNDGCPANGTPESGPQCTNSADDDGDFFVNDGCPQVGATTENQGQCDGNADNDADTWVNDGCPLVGTRGESSLIEICDGLDNDADTTVDEGYPDTNPGGPKDCMDSLVDTDGDTLVNTADTNDDDDGNPEDPDWNDGWFSDALEVYIGSDSLDACPDNTNDDAWPPDFNNDTRVMSFDILFLRLSIGSIYGGSYYERDKLYNRRYDLNMNGSINSLDVLFLRPYIGITCVQ